MPLATLPPFIPVPAQDNPGPQAKAKWNINKASPALPNARDMTQEDTTMSTRAEFIQNPTPWMSRRDQQPFMYPAEASSQDTEA